MRIEVAEYSAPPPDPPLTGADPILVNTLHQKPALSNTLVADMCARGNWDTGVAEYSATEPLLCG